MDHGPPPAIIEEADWLARAEALYRELGSVYVSKYELTDMRTKCFGAIPEKPEKENK
jgi:hypothetical protein